MDKTSETNKHENGEAKQFFQFVKDNKWPLLAAFVFALICFGFMLTHYNLTIDEETWIRETPGADNWIHQGRFGIFLIDLLISPSGSYVPFLWDWVAVILWFLAAPPLLFMLLSGARLSLPHKFYGQFTVFAFCAFFVSLPAFVGEILSYSMFNLQISIGMLCAVGACWFIYLFSKQKRWLYLPIAVILLTFSISVYQAYINLFLTWVISLSLFGVVFAVQKLRDIFVFWGKSAVVVAASLILYLLFDRLFNALYGYSDAGSAGAMSGHVGWMSGGGLGTTILNAFVNALSSSFGYHFSMGRYFAYISTAITSLAFLIALIYFAVTIKNIKRTILTFVIALLLLIAPSASYILMGTVLTPARMLLSAALMAGVQWVFILQLAKPKTILRVISLFAVCALLAYNAFRMNRLFYDSHQVYLNDQVLMTDIVEIINENGYDMSGTPVFFVGAYDIPENVTLILSGSTGGSFWSWDNGNNYRIQNFLLAESHNVSLPALEQREAALLEVLALPNWPDAGAVKEIDGCIYVKLSEPTELWYDINMIHD